MDPREKTQEAVTDCVLLERVPGGCRILLVVFAAANARSFTFYNTTRSLPCDVLYVRDPRKNSWFQEGFLPEGGIDASAEYLRALAASYDRVVVSGASMGGYAAILFGSLIGASCIFALGPQTQLNHNYSRSPRRDVALRVPDLADIVAASPSGQIHMMVGVLDAVDYFNVVRLVDLGGAEVYCFEDEDHFLPKSLARSEALTRLFTAAVEGLPLDPAPHPFVARADLDQARCEMIRAAVPLMFEKRDYRAARALVRPFLTTERSWALAHYLWGASAFKDGLFTPAMRELRTAANLFPNSVDYNMLAAEAALHSGDRLMAESFARRVLAVRSGNPRARAILAGGTSVVDTSTVALDEAPPE
jgi:hypothetical protein